MTDSDSAAAVCVIGLGNMGSALAKALLTRGHKVKVWNRTASKCDVLVEAGASVAASAVAGAAACDLTIVCVTDHAASAALLQNEEMANALRGKTLVQLTTQTAEDSCETSGWADQHGVTYLEGSILGLPQDVMGGSAIIIYAGPNVAFEENKRLFSALGGGPQFLSEEIGAAVTFDRVYYIFAFGLFQCFVQGAALAHAKGFSIDAYTKTAIARLPAFDWKLQMYADMITAGNYDNAQGGLDVFKECFAESLEMCRALGVDDSLPSVIMDIFERTSAAGHGQKEFPAMFEVMRTTQGVQH